METVITFTIEENMVGKRADAALHALCIAEGDALPSQPSRTYLQQLIKSKDVTLNDSPLKTASTKVALGDVLVVTIPAPVPLNLTPEDIPLDIIYEDDALLVVNKAAGIAVHPAVGNASGTLVHALLYHCQGELSGINGVERPGIVHRLDKDTTGLIVCAKNDVAHKALAEQFANKTARRVYEALVVGVPLPSVGTIEGIIGRNPANRKQMAVLREVTEEDVSGEQTSALDAFNEDETADNNHGMSDGSEGKLPFEAHKRSGGRGKSKAPWMRGDKAKKSSTGKFARTHYQTLNTFFGTLSHIQCKLDTGRTHQIRVHMAHLGYPIVGDSTYGTNNPIGNLPPEVAKALSTIKTQLLHARTLTFTHPISGEEVTFEAPLPASFSHMLKIIA